MLLPFVRELFADVEKLPAFTRAASHLKEGTGRMRVSGLTPTAKALLLVLLQRAADRPFVVVVNDNRAAEDFVPLLRGFSELTAAGDPEAVVALPARDVLPFQNLSPHPELQEERATALWKIASGKAAIVVSPIAATAIRLRSAEYYSDLARTVRRGESIDVDSLLGHLNTVGYSSADVVEMPGQYALRGGILDAYSPEAERPVRIEFFGDEVESIRRFDPASQRSSNPMDEALLLPLTETPVSDQLLGAIHTRLSGKRIAGSEEAVEAAVRAGGATVFPGWEFYAPVAGADRTVFELLPRAAVLLDEPDLLRSEFDRFWTRVVETHERSGVGNLVRPEDLYLAPDHWWKSVTLLFGADVEHLGVTRGEDADSTVGFLTQSTPRFHGAVPVMLEEVRKLTREGNQVMFAVPNTGEIERLADIFTEYNVSFRLGSRTRGGETYADETSYFAGEVLTTTLAKAYVPDGVLLPEANLAVFGARDLFDESDTVASRPQRQKSKVSAFLSDFRDLQVGDYVVHVEHGIGQYQGLKEINQGDGNAEFMLLEYAETARLYVPLTRLDLIQKYRSSEGAKPALSHLGTQAWAKTKARVRKAMKDMADELLKLYAARKLAQGHSFSADSEFVREFEDAFEFSETEDQAQAITDVIRDMESSQPMDRLLCGDVGYGKTEVAMRAAFKAVSDNKQVAVLAPTTVLAFQHYETFKQRFGPFPVTIEMISRFRNPKQQKEILQKLEAGKIDILIGTHRLLSKDLKFADLGLLIVDEEQRFGVRHKERIKQMRKQVDVLTMSATPIPRTLHMSLVGLRDMSVIETPPKDRMAIQTVVASWDDKLIQSAVEQELERGGQVYFVHNRVESIWEIAAKLQELAPKARIAVGHGQMSESELEKVMLKFMHHEADILVATTIIENGLDIPLCNTILINRADRLGLSELYQLRGRVGRSNRRAYAYLLIPREIELTPLARRRLAALKEFSDLGAGFKIAALDLELRGAGNLLGGEQSGHIEAVGFELYTQMLERAVREMKGETSPEEAETQLNLGLNIRIPADYIPEENQRLRMYKRVAGVETESQLGDVGAELQDRYGPPPPAVRNLLDYASLKLLCLRVGVNAIERKRDSVTFKFRQNAAVDPEQLARFVSAQRGAQFTPDGMLKFVLKATAAEEVLRALRTVLEQLASEEAASEVGSSAGGKAPQ
ncbi:Transcription-repair-coupling factor [Candidatus Sulfotelmatobacter kueseliae]|uniref:Transcription-repair-coupling factor n=1 Tax=Candidatus Sulfotelmatobacter kueseliae TaxID=2042962 RepID=A0A2U3KJ53_9BACT|nr:Transcription-repair-coupling factor [Candidatus Sulfotelmatobacter kueseliae]